MRNLFLCGYKWDKKFFFAFLVAIICSIICGILLYKPVISNVYLKDSVTDYIYYVFNFKNGSLIFPHLLGNIILFYIAFLLANCTRYKYLAIIPVFVRGVFFGVYSAILFCFNSFGGIAVAIIVYIPSSFIAFAITYLLCEFGRYINTKFVMFAPGISALADTLVYLILINLIFRLIIIIV